MAYYECVARFAFKKELFDEIYNIYGDSIHNFLNQPKDPLSTQMTLTNIRLTGKGDFPAFMSKSRICSLLKDTQLASYYI